jgi:hypothetical protein
LSTGTQTGIVTFPYTPMCSRPGFECQMEWILLKLHALDIWLLSFIPLTWRIPYTDAPGISQHPLTGTEPTPGMGDLSLAQELP